MQWTLDTGHWTLDTRQWTHSEYLELSQMKTVTRQEKLTVEHKTFLGLKGKDMEEMKKQEFDMALQVMITTF